MERSSGAAWTVRAVDLALKGDWDRAAQVNRAILELFSDDVEAMNRLAKALIELGSYEEAGSVLDHLGEVAPYNNIARKNRAPPGADARPGQD